MHINAISLYEKTQEIGPSLETPRTLTSITKQALLCFSFIFLLITQQNQIFSPQPFLQAELFSVLLWQLYSCTSIFLLITQQNQIVQSLAVLIGRAVFSFIMVALQLYIYFLTDHLVESDCSVLSRSYRQSCFQFYYGSFIVVHLFSY